MCRGSEAGSYLRLIDFCSTQLEAQGPSRICNESEEEPRKHAQMMQSSPLCRRAACHASSCANSEGVCNSTPSPFFKNVWCEREPEILVEQQPPQGVFVCDHAGRVISKLSCANSEEVCNSTPVPTQKGFATPLPCQLRKVLQLHACANSERFCNSLCQVNKSKEVFAISETCTNYASKFPLNTPIRT